MGNQQYREIVAQRITGFLSRFESTRRLYSDDLKKNSCYHRGEFGRSREDACISLLETTICSAFGVSRGFVLNYGDQRTTECDIIIHNPLYHPLKDPTTGTNFFTAESVVAIGEVKSILTKSKLKKALQKLASNKRIRDCLEGRFARDVRTFQLVSADTEAHHTVPPFTFLICEKIEGFDNGTAKDIANFYSDENIPRYLHHNIVLSIFDGVLTYDGSQLSRIIGEKVRVFPYPKLNKETDAPSAIAIPGRPDHNVLAFLINLSNSLENTHSFYPEPTHYLSR